MLPLMAAIHSCVLHAVYTGTHNQFEVQLSDVHIPTILIGEAKSKYISDLDGFRLPFAIILHDSNNEFIDFQSTLNNNSLNLSVVDKMQFVSLDIIKVYSLTPNDAVSQITETMELDGVNIDLAKGRVV